MGQTDLFEKIIVDNFAGGGGASTGIELACGRPVTIAINHDPDAIAMHRTNHPYTEHLQASVWDVDPEQVCHGRKVGLAWFSPDCKHFSKAKGAALVDRNIRGLAWIVLRWAGTVRPDVILLENVEEFITWGPVRKGKPVKRKAGQTFAKWKRQLQALGYVVEHRVLVAADYGTPTSRKRFVLVARCDGKPIVWPKRTHAPRNSPEVQAGKLKPWRSAAEVIDWSIPGYSIFQSKEEIKERCGATVVRPLAENTLRRVIRGVDKFTLKSGEPFLVPTGYGERQGQAPRVHDIKEPVPTVVGAGKHQLVTANLVEYYTGGRPLDVQDPMHTVTSHDREALVTAHIAEFKGCDIGQDVKKPLRTITASAGEFGLVRTVLSREKGMGYWPQVRDLLNTYCGYDLKENECLVLMIGGVGYYIADITLRMLTPRELYNAMGFPPDYKIDRDYKGNVYGKTKQVARCGNAVCPPLAEAMVRANLPEWCGKKITTMEQLNEIQTA